jgi:hypothetical protein
MMTGRRVGFDLYAGSVTRFLTYPYTRIRILTCEFELSLVGVSCR